MKRDEAIEWLMRTTGPDEEVYPLVGRDVFASDLVRRHADLMRSAGVRADKIGLAFRCASIMAVSPHKIPD